MRSQRFNLLLGLSVFLANWVKNAQHNGFVADNPLPGANMGMTTICEMLGHFRRYSHFSVKNIFDFSIHRFCCFSAPVSLK
jgi:hypothetical protein